jgi:hypothetical protein
VAKIQSRLPFSKEGAFKTIENIRSIATTYRFLNGSVKEKYGRCASKWQIN